MSNKVENRTVNMYINGKPVYNDILSMEAAYRSLSGKVKDLDRNSKEYRKGVKQLGQLRGMINTHRRDIGSMQSAWKRVHTTAMGFLGAMGIAGGFQMLSGVIRDGVQIITNYQDANAKLNAVLGLTKDQTEALREQQLSLGASTEFTAANAAEAQTELARLGFTLTEITNMTPSVLSLASAAGTDLANAAEIAGATMRGFGMNSSETNRVVDVMAKSFQSSALNIDKFQIAMRQVAPVAKNANLDIEQTTALLGVLIDRGVRAESAGTGLRNILGRLAQSGMTWSDAMSQINSSTDSTRTAIELFGLEASTMAIILAQNSDAAGLLEGKLRDAGGAAEAMAKEQLNTLSGDLTILRSAWEGLILSIENGEGVFSKAMRSITQGVTNLIGDIQSTNQVSAQLQETLGLTYWKDGLLSPALYKNLGEFQESLNAIADTTSKYANDGAWGKMESNVQMLRDMASVIDDSTEEGANKIKLIEAQLKSLEKIRAEAFKDQDFIKTEETEKPTNKTKTTTTTTTTKTPEEIRADKAKEALEALKLVKAEEELLLAQERADGLIDEQLYQDEMLALKLSSLYAERAVLEEMGMSVVDVERRIADMRIAELNKLEDAQEAARTSEKRISDERKEDAKREAEALQAAAEAAIESAAMQGSAAISVGQDSKEQAAAVLNNTRQIIKAYIAQAVAAQMTEVLAKVPPPFSLVLAAAAGAAASILFDSLIPAFAGGTRNAPGGLSLVGEQGPELVNLPAGAAVTPASDSRNLMYGPDQGLNFSGVPSLSGGSGGDVAQLRASFDQYAQRVDQWARELQVINSKRADDEWNQRYKANERMVRNIK